MPEWNLKQQMLQAIKEKGGWVNCHGHFDKAYYINKEADLAVTPPAPSLTAFAMFAPVSPLIPEANIKGLANFLPRKFICVFMTLF